MRFLHFSLLGLCVLAAGFAENSNYGISGNPGAVNVLTGTGDLGDLLHIPRSSGVRLAGLWMGDVNEALSGVHGRRFTANNLFIADLSVDFDKAFHWKGGLFCVEFLQFNGQPTNKDAGAAQGYNSITGDPPLDRSELYQLWLRQEFFHGKFSLRVGKTVPIYHFNNVSKPVPTQDPAVFIPSVSGLIYTPLFVNTTMLGAIGGYYNSVYGAVATISPTPEAYLNVGFFDGSLARGKQTGLRGPHFNGYYFSIAEAGYGWAGSRPGIAAIGGWHQSGKIKAGGQVQRGMEGVYLFGSQAIWIGKNQQNLSGFYQFGWNDSKTLPMDRYAGMGLSGFALIPGRPGDSFGVGVAWSRLNRHLFPRRTEWMLQGYYQMLVYHSIYFQPVISYIPHPGLNEHESNVCAITARMTILF